MKPLGDGWGIPMIASGGRLDQGWMEDSMADFAMITGGARFVTGQILHICGGMSVGA